MDSKNFAIGVLSTTAVILLVGLLVIQTRPEPAYGFGMNAQGGDYVLITGQLQESEELLYVIDAGTQRINVYRFDINRKQINLTQSDSLARLSPGGREESGKKKGRSQGRGSRGRGRR